MYVYRYTLYILSPTWAHPFSISFLHMATPVSNFFADTAPKAPGPGLDPQYYVYNNTL